MSEGASRGGNGAEELAELRRRQLAFGWGALLVFLLLGALLEALHGFKVRAYLDVANETRRHLWTLAHAHGALLAVINVVFGLSLEALPHWSGPRRLLASRCLRAAGVLVPAGFFLGGVVFHAGDPGLGILLLPPGALLLFLAVLAVARASARRAP